jgi:hypothetical protein
MKFSAACSSSLAAALLAIAAYAEEPREQAGRVEQAPGVEPSGAGHAEQGVGVEEPGAGRAEQGVGVEEPRAGLAAPGSDLGETEPQSGESGFDLEELMNGMASTSGVMADFREQKEIALLEKPLASSGKIYFVPPNRLVRFTFEPESSALIIDGDKLRFQRGTSEKFDLSGSPMARIFIDNFIVLFNGDLPKLRELYHTTFGGDGERWTLILEPRRAPLSQFIAEIALRGDRKGIREMVMQNRDGDRTSTTLDVISTDHHFTDDQLEDLFVDGIAP